MKIQDIGFILDVKPCKSDEQMVKKLYKLLDMSKPPSKMKKMERVGNSGKEGEVFKVVIRGKEYALKQFRKSKSINRIREEAFLQQIGAHNDLSPIVRHIDTENRNIVMDLMDKSILDIIVSNDGLIPFKFQKQIIDIFKKLDSIGVFHADPNPTNFMLKGQKIYLIDYGFAVPITPALMKKHKTDTPNMKFMVLGLMSRLKELFGNNLRSAYYLESFLSSADKKMIL